MSTEKIAIDIVLLLPPQIADLCVSFNSKFTNEGYVFMKDGYNPHITLSMGGLHLSDVEKLKGEISVFLKDRQKIDLEITNIDTGKYNYFDFKITPELQSLHEGLMTIILKYSSLPVARENFFESQGVEDSLIDWVNNFSVNSSYDKYHPHITLGTGEVIDDNIYPIKFTCETVGLFNLGQYGTCKKELARFELK
jgi:2'-5' RNA ligase